MPVALLPALLLACTADPGDIVVATTPDLEPVLSAFIADIDDPRIRLGPTAESDKAAATLARQYADGVSVVEDGYLLDPETYAGTVGSDDPADRALHLTAGNALGAQYALADALERRGYGFYHPEETVIPEDLGATGWGAWDGSTQAPETAIRGLDPHTLHPIEYLQDAWMTDDPDGLGRAERVVDWLVKNRGNQLQWPALENILTSSADAAAWADQTSALVDYAHERGVTMAAGVELFGGANLQLAFDLVDDTTLSEDERRQIMSDRLHVLLHPSGGPAVAFDKVNLSFGEFTSEDPGVFLDNVNLFADVLRSISTEEGRAIEPDATVHVGANQTVTYDNQEIEYYFLVKYADPTIVPYVHTVMYYNLWDDAGGAYGYDSFSAYKDYIQERMDASQPVVYFPESAYWCAFDSPVPLYLPIYLDSRLHDQQEWASIGEKAPSQVLFSSGWEWGYWQNDVAVLKMGWKLPATIQDLVDQDFPSLPSVTREMISVLAGLQYDALIGQRLAPWMAGRDAFMDIGRGEGVVGQPDRPTFAEIVGMSAEDRATFKATVVDPLAAHGAATRALLAPVIAAGQAHGQNTRWQREVQDGIEIDALRAEYMSTVLSAVLDHADGDDVTAGSQITAAEALKSAASYVVARRHADLHDPVPGRLTGLLENPTFYDYGYLRHADTLCFWERDRVQVRNLVLGESNADPGCTFD